MDELDIWRSANLLIKQHGEGAEFVAALRAEELLARGEPWGEATWKRILAVIHQIEKGEQGNDEALH